MQNFYPIKIQYPPFYGRLIIFSISGKIHPILFLQEKSFATFLPELEIAVFGLK